MKNDTAVKVSAVRKIWDDAKHNAFTDMIRFGGRLYIAFRSHPVAHDVLTGSTIVVLASEDGGEWTKVHEFGVADRDVRDPHFVEFKGRLHIYTGTWYIDPETGDHSFPGHKGYVVTTADGAVWSEPTAMESTKGYYIWRTAAYGGTVYLCGRRYRPGTGTDEVTNPPILQAILLASEDGYEWRERGILTENPGNETAFLFEDNGDLLAIGRGRPTTRICRAKPPYTEMSRVELDRYIGGPLVVKWGADILVGGRKQTDAGPRTVLSWLIDDDFVDCAELPSGGDNSYPGFVSLDDKRALLSYYSSHEGSGGKTAPCSIYLARLER